MYNNIDDFVERLIKLRLEKGISSRCMSISLGQSSSYINNIENKNCLPSMAVFFNICEYLKITPKEFFDYDLKCPILFNDFIIEFYKLDYKELNHILEIIKDINKYKR